jgi:hypothetical protein
MALPNLRVLASIPCRASALRAKSYKAYRARQMLTGRHLHVLSHPVLRDTSRMMTILVLLRAYGGETPSCQVFVPNYA